MRRTTVIVDGRRFLLSPTSDTSELERDAVAATRAGGDLVRFVLLGERVVSVLVSPGVPLVFEYEDVPEEDAHADEDASYRYDDIEYLT